MGLWGMYYLMWEALNQKRVAVENKTIIDDTSPTMSSTSNIKQAVGLYLARPSYKPQPLAVRRA